MSDERDEADAAGNGAGDASGNGSGNGRAPLDPALVTTPLRPTGKRSRQRQGGVALAEREDTDEALTEEFESLDGKKPKKAKKGEGGHSRNPFAFVWNYLRQVAAEISKVIWPSRSQMVNYTIVVLLFLAFMTTLIGLVDLGLAKLVLLVFG